MHKSKPATNESIFGVGHRHGVGIASFLILVLLAFGGGCSEPTVADQCKETERTLIEPLFRIHFVITRLNGDPHLGAVNFQSEKHYCDGTVKGVFSDAAETIQNGYWKPITTQYKLANAEDFVVVKFSANSFSEDTIYSYDVVDEGATWLDGTFQLVFEDTIQVHLNW